MKVDRKIFLKKVLAGIANMSVYTLLSCSGDDSANSDLKLDRKQTNCSANSFNAIFIGS